MDTLLDTYVKELAEDVKVDAFNIKEVQMKIPSIKHKWVARLVRCKQDIIKLTREREKHKKALMTQLQKEAPTKISEFNAIKAIESTPSIKEFDEKIEECKLIIELLEKSEKTLSSMTYDIKNIVEIIKLETT